jgi:hypothetical protein
MSWSALAETDDGLAAWCAPRWLAAWPSLTTLPAAFATTRASLHRVAAYVVAPARRRATGKIGLRWTRGGFGTPFFGDDEQVRIDGGALVVCRDGTGERYRLVDLASAAALVAVDLDDDPGVGHDLPPLGDVHADLDVDSAAAAVLGDWYGFGVSVLEQLRFERRCDGVEVSRVQLWPEHFDLAFDAAGVNVGFSPGDGFDVEPYLYVGPWQADGLEGDYWNAPFGAVLRYAELQRAAGHRAAALDFLREGVARAALLTSG